MTISPLRQLRPELLHSGVEELGWLLCQPFLIYGVSVPSLGFGDEFVENPPVARFHSFQTSGRCGADFLQFFQPPAELLPHAASAQSLPVDFIERTSFTKVILDNRDLTPAMFHSLMSSVVNGS